MGRRDSQVSFVRYVYVNAMLDTEDSDNQVFLEFIEFVNKMAHFSSTEGTDGLGVSSGSSGIFNFICGLDNGVKDLEGFLDEAGIKTALVERDIIGEKTIYCKMANKEIPFEEVLSSGMEALVILYFWHVQGKDFLF